MTNGYSFGALEGHSTGCSPRFRPVFRDSGATYETAGYTNIDTTLVNMFDNSVTALLGCCFKWEATGYDHCCRDTSTRTKAPKKRTST